MHRRHVDRIFLIITVSLLLIGFLIFSSASLGLLARTGAQYSTLAVKQLFSVGLGIIAMLALARIPYRTWRPWALHIFIAALILSLLVFVPGLGFTYNGARRWIVVGGFSLQPSEFLKYASIIFTAAWLASTPRLEHRYTKRLIPFLGIIGAITAVLLLQRDSGTLLVIVASLTAMYVVAGAPWRDVGILAVVGVVGATLLVLWRPYILQRFLTFLDPSSDPLGAGYQLQQSLIAIGSGSWLGRGFGQSIQKFNFLPEPIGDSIFSVAAEEFGFLGGLLLLSLFALFAYRGLSIAMRSRDIFGGLLVVGIVIIIVLQSFVNIGSMLGVLPLTGVPLLFISNGGTAMVGALAGVGLVLSVSRAAQRTR